MASKKEQKSSPSSSPKRDQKVELTSADQTVEHQSFLEAAKQQHQANLPKDVKTLGERFAELYKKNLAIEEEKAKTVIPYYSDLRTNKFAVLSKEGIADQDDPFNKSVAAFLSGQNEGEVFRFEDPGIKKESLPLLDDLSIYIHKLKKAAFDYKVENGSSARSTLFKYVNNYVADIYWELGFGLTNCLIPKDLLSKYLDKKVNVTKKMTYNHRSVLSGLLQQMNEGPNKDRMANAYCHLIRSAVEDGIKLQQQFFRLNLIAKEKRFTPTLTMLTVKGIIPDFKIRRYNSLFLSSEIENIRDSELERAESELQNLFKIQISYDNLPKILKDIEKLKSKVEAETLSLEIKKVKKERLLQASNLKSAHKKGTFNLNRAVANNLVDVKVREAFNPFRLPFAEGEIETAPGLAINVISYNEVDNIYHYVQSEYNDKLDGGKVKAIALEFVAYLER
ncbi:MAG: hypothetical protein [Verticillium dahliae ormycovirus 1]|nr:MAG: hypothetical protein [Verticillium dahliae ormycovirus 1]